jgi:hypothetical protein
MSKTTEARQPQVTAYRPDQAIDLPAVLVELMADEPALASHVQVGDRYRALTGRAVELARELEQARRDDDERRRGALASGRRPPQPKASAIEAEFAQTRRDVELLSDAVLDSARKFASRAVAFIDEADAEGRRREAALVAGLRDLFTACDAAIVQLRELGHQQRWISELRLSGRVIPWTAGGKIAALGRTADAVLRLPLELDADLGAAAERQAQDDREAAHDSRLPAPPGSPVWAPGQPDKVTAEDGSLRDDDEAER